MSTILKALRRLEQEKSAQVDRPLSEAVASAVPPPSPRASRGWPKIVGAVVVAAVVVVVGAYAALRWLGGETPQSAEVAAVSPVSEEVAPRAAPAVTPPKKPRRTQTPRQAASKRLAAKSQRRPRPEPSARPARAVERGLSPQALTSDVAVIDRGSPKLRLQDPDEPLVRAAEAVAPAEPARMPTGLRAAKTPAESLRTAPVPRGAAAGAPPVALPPVDLTSLVAPSPAAEAAGVPPEAPPVAIASAPIDIPPLAAPRPAAEAAAAPPVDLPEVPSARPAPKPETIELAVKQTPPSSSKPAVRSPARTDSPPRPAVPAPASSRPARLPVPEIYVDRTIWHPDASRRVAFVEIAGSGERLELHEGEAVGSLVVEKIEPSGVSFDHRGTEVRRRVGAR